MQKYTHTVDKHELTRRKKIAKIAKRKAQN